MPLSLESLLVGAFVVPLAGATRAFRNRSGTHRPAGVGEHGQTGIGVPQELGSSCHFHGKSRVGIPSDQPQARRCRTQRRRERNLRDTWYRQVKETKRGGRNGRKSQCLDSTVEAGEQTPVRTPWRKARHRDYGLVVGTYGGYLEIRCTYYRNSNG